MEQVMKNWSRHLMSSSFSLISRRLLPAWIFVFTILLAKCLPAPSPTLYFTLHKVQATQSQWWTIMANNNLLFKCNLFCTSFPFKHNLLKRLAASGEIVSYLLIILAVLFTCIFQLSIPAMLTFKKKRILSTIFIRRRFKLKFQLSEWNSLFHTQMHLLEKLNI